MANPSKDIDQSNQSKDVSGKQKNDYPPMEVNKGKKSGTGFGGEMEEEDDLQSTSKGITTTQKSTGQTGMGGSGGSKGGFNRPDRGERLSGNLGKEGKEKDIKGTKTTTGVGGQSQSYEDE